MNRIQISGFMFLLALLIVGSGIVATAAELAADDPQNPCSWMRDSNPRFQEIKKIREDFYVKHIVPNLKPGQEFVSLSTGCDDLGEPFFEVGINPDRIEVIEEKGLPEVWEGIPVKYLGMVVKKVI